MKFDPRKYTGDSDQQAMLALARAFPDGNLHVIDLPYRLSSWALDDPDNVGLWFGEDGQLAGWAVLQVPFWTVDIACHPACETELYPEILAWADRQAHAALDTPSGHPAWFVMAFAGQASRCRALESAGFACQADVGENSWSKVLMRRSTPEPVKLYEPRAGFTVRPLAGMDEVAAYVELHQSVFESKNMTVDWRARSLRQSAYHPDLDLVVAADDGRLAAFCICWLDGESLRGHVEPLGCHKDFRPFALGRVALSHGLHRLQSLGAREIFVETDNYRDTAFRLYESFGFEVIQDVLVYRKDYE
jgi:ribosomal protein S18 acetylase RimI-like enzyme